MKTESLKDCLKIQDFIEEKIEHYKAEKVKIEEIIESLVGESLRRSRLLHGKDTGTVVAMVEGIEIKQNLPKRIVWNQDKMKQIVIKIQESGDDPDQYISVKYSISEKQFRDFPLDIRKFFMQAREVNTGKARLTFKLREV